MYIPSGDEYAFMTPDWPSTVIVTDKEIETEREAVSVVVLHEALHVIDCTLGWKLSGVDGFLTMSGEEKFLSLLSERNFFPAVGGGGHPETNKLELFASTINSLTCPDWAAVLRSHRENRPFLMFYGRLIFRLEEHLRQIAAAGTISTDAPIFSLMEERKKALESMVRQDTGGGVS